jgi:hypothetical protein
VVPFLLASIVYHAEFLRKNLPPAHPLFNANIFSQGFVTRFEGRILLGSGRCDNTGMTASGVPQMIAMVHEIKDLKQEMQSMEARRLADLQTLSSLILSIPDQVTMNMLERIRVEGVQPVTLADVQRLLKENTDSIRSHIDGLVVAGARLGAHSPPVTGPAAAASSQTPEFATWQWAHPNDAGQLSFHMCPADFELPRGNAKDMWTLWHFGHRENRIGPSESSSSATCNLVRNRSV